MLFLRFCLKGHGETSAKLLKTISRIQKFFLAEAVSYELQTYGQALWNPSPQGTLMPGRPARFTAVV